ncbi:SH3 domain-containing protein [Leptospira stimsonii]|uniref:SH3 domain-containing protein n=1 Tax=Leptospira stimsonii TaxID=2202203 RepID=A0ABY2MTZ7_9LEPT|nr:SH3 domain-containing protein [Leptospira stimsonii]TGK14270.1 SH3 domain-containing protein [Leptospira stimsonii]TGM07873.1 SH3 domain-containing protein [Leptospira stimsonii]
MKIGFLSLFALLTLTCSLSNKPLNSPFKNPTLFAISGDQVRLRGNPSIKSAIVENLPKGEQIEIISFDKSEKITLKLDQGRELSGYWVKIRKWQDGKEGYIFSPYIGFDLGKDDSDNYLVASVGPAKFNEYQIIAVSKIGVAENPTKYFSEKAVLFNKIPKKDLVLINFDGTQFGKLSEVKFSSKSDGCKFLIKCVSGKLSDFDQSLQKQRVVIGGTFSKRYSNIKVDINTSITKELRDVIFKDTISRLKSDRNAPNDFIMPDCKKHYKYYQFKTQRDSVEYLISEYSNPAGMGSGHEKVDPHFYRIDKINGNEFENLEFHATFNYQLDVAETIGKTDINDDGFPEVWRSWFGYEWWYYSITVIKENWAIPVYTGGGGGV